MDEKPPLYSSDNPASSPAPAPYPNQPPAQPPVGGQQPMGGYSGPGAPPAGQGQNYPPPPPGYAGAPLQYSNTSHVIITQPGVVQGAPSFGPDASVCTCQYCNNNITTTTSKTCSALVWIICGVICLIGILIPFVWFGCCLIPFCIPPLYNTEHKCPNCGRVVGTYKSGGIG